MQLRNLLIKSQSNKPLNEALEEQNSNGKKYIFKGVFTQCSVPGHIIENRNHRIYKEETVLPHLKYLRDKIQQDGCLLGELDHPEDRFEVKLKDVSHKVIDLWYDSATHCVMGKIQLLDTPNGKIAKDIVDSGYPLYISSRAAGDVNKRTHEVEIAQIFTYDIVCTPGFANARLDRVNESLSDKTVGYLLESQETLKTKKNDNAKYKVLDEGTEVFETSEQIRKNPALENILRNKVNLNEIESPLSEKDDHELDGVTGQTKTPTQVNNTKSAKEAGLEFRDLSIEGNKVSPAKKLNEPLKEEVEKDKKDLILDIKGIEKDSLEDKEESKEDSSKDKEKEKKDFKDSILDIKAEVEDEAKDDLKKSSKKKEDHDKESDSVKLEKKENNKEKKEDDDIKESLDKCQDLINSVNKKSKVKESLLKRYPFSISLNETNWSRFVELSPEDKDKCNAFIIENAIFDAESINELWKTPLLRESKERQDINEMWIKLASPEDLKLFNESSEFVKNSIRESASMLVFESKSDVDEFWSKTGLRQQAQQRINTQRFIEDYPALVNPEKYDDDRFMNDIISLTESYMMKDDED